jgi:hypothetical protein
MPKPLNKDSLLTRLKRGVMQLGVEPVLLADEAERFRRWAANRSPEQRRGEWEGDYVRWDPLYASAVALLDAAVASDLTDANIADLLFVIARDNESENLAEHLAQDEASLLLLAEASIASTETDAKWQLAEQLGAVTTGRSEAELLLLQLANDSDEYVRRRALTSLGALKSIHAEALAVRAWDTGLEYQCIAALWVLKAIDSARLAEFLAKANEDGRTHVMQNAREIQG